MNERTEPTRPVYDPRPLRIETADPGVFVDLDALARDAAIQSLKESDAPIARAAELVAAIAGDAQKIVTAMRVEQIVKHGHTQENDDMLPLLWLPRQAKDQAQTALEAIGVTGNGRDLDVAIRRLARSAALCMASIDRLLAAKRRGEG